MLWKLVFSTGPMSSNVMEIGVQHFTDELQFNGICGSTLDQ